MSPATSIMGRLVLRRILFSLMVCVLTLSAQAQTLRGRVLDSLTREPIPYATVSPLHGRGDSYGAVSDASGDFRLELHPGAIRGGQVKLLVRSVGYTPREWTWLASKGQQLGDILLSEQGSELQTLVVTPRKERYRRRGNPAVVLMERIIKAKEENRVSAFDDYSYREYERMLISQVGSARGTKYFGIDAEVADRFRDSSLLTPTHTMPLSLREKQTVHASRGGSRLSPVVTGRRVSGVEQGLDEGTLSNGIDGLLGDFDVYADNLELLMTHFPSPLNKHWATHFYKFYIQDTVSYEGAPCFLMHFRPMNPRSTGMNGHIWIDTLQLSMRHIEMTLPPASNVNWVERMSISTSFAPVTSPRGEIWLPASKQIDLVLKPTDLIKEGLEVNLLRHYYSYRFGTEALEPASLDPRSQLSGAVYADAMLPRPGSYGLVDRVLPLSPREQKAIDFVHYLHTHRGFRSLSAIGRALSTGFISLPASPLNKDRILFDLGPYETFVGYNGLEGARLRIGGMTTANLMQHLFLEGYLGYGLGDHRWKYYLRATYTPRRRSYHAQEHPRHHLSLSGARDLFIPGSEDLGLFHDGLQTQLGNFHNRTRFYADKFVAEYTRDWTNQLSTTLSAEYARKRPAGDLSYLILTQDLTPQRLPYIEESAIGAEMKVVIGEARFRRPRREGALDIARYLPTIGLSARLYPKGLPGNSATYARLAMNYKQRIYLSFFGRLDAEAEAGILLGDAPQTAAFHPRANNSWILRRGTFQTLRPLEYIADKYVRLQADYHANGLLLTRLPLIRHLNLREVLGVQAYWGDMSSRTLRPRAGRPYLPSLATPMKRKLHVELQAGIENILKVLRIDYVYRLTDQDISVPHRSVVRLQVKVAF